ncbi:MAG: ABC transporter permease [Lachnospiraceae bacterium]|nr:ABC transporter permease [Lachnospiraceae bacterium]
MKKHYIRLMLRSLWKTRSRFLSILTIVAIGVGFLGGLLATTPDMRLSADRYYDENNTYDINIRAPLGLTEEDAASLQDISETVMPARVLDLLFSIPGRSFATRVYGLDALDREEQPELNQFILTEGRLPQSPNECVAASPNGYLPVVSLGETVSISSQNADYEECLDRFKVTEYTVVGIVTTPLFISVESEPCSVGSGTIGLVLFVPGSSFNMDVYTDIFLTVPGASSLNAFEQEYKDLVYDFALQVEDIGGDRAQIRFGQVMEDAQKALNAKWDEYHDAESEAESELSEARDQLDQAAADIADGKQQLEDAQQQIDDGWAQIGQAQQTLKTEQEKAEQELLENLSALEQEQVDALLEEIEAARLENQTLIDENLAAWQADSDALEARSAQAVATEAALLSDRASYNDSLAVDTAAYGAVRAEYALLSSSASLLQGTIDTLQSSLDSDQLSEAAKTLCLAQMESTRTQLEQTQTRLQGLETDMEKANTSSAALDATYASLTEKEQALAAEWAAIAGEKIRLEITRVAISSGQQQLDESIEENKQLVEENRPFIRESILEAGMEMIREGTYDARQLINLSMADLQAAQTEVDENRKKLEKAETDLAAGEEEYDLAKKDALAQLRDARDKLQEAQEELDAMELSDWYIFDRTDNYGFNSFYGNSGKVGAIAKVFPVFFFLVAALVALTTMTRLVEEERGQMGTLKALGFGSGKILFYYVTYGAAAALIGSVAGITLGFYTLPAVIANAYTMLFTVPPTRMFFFWDYALIIVPAAVLCVVASTLFACVSQLRERPSLLMMPKAPKAGKRILLERIAFIWKKLSFTQKVTCRNIFRYKKRLFMTVVGIAGCTALLVAGFGIRDSVRDIVGKQFDEISRYDLLLVAKEEASYYEDDILSGMLNDSTKVSAYTLVHTENLKSSTFDLTLYVPQKLDSFLNIMTLRELWSGEPVSLTEDTAVITQKLSENLGIQVGDILLVSDDEDQLYEVLISGIVENYIGDYIYMGPSMYDRIFQKETDHRLSMVQLSDSVTDQTAFTEALLQSENITYINRAEGIRTSFSNTVSKIDYIVMVLILCAGGLAVVVVYNLTNINISERKKELATLKVLGFHEQETAMYIYRETAALSLIGTLAGCFLGAALHRFVVACAEVDTVMFGRLIAWPSYLWSVLITLVFTVLVNFFMLPQIRKISMVESLKAPE